MSKEEDDTNNLNRKNKLNKENFDNSLNQKKNREYFPKYTPKPFGGGGLIHRLFNDDDEEKGRLHSSLKFRAYEINNDESDYPINWTPPPFGTGGTIHKHSNDDSGFPGSKSDINPFDEINAAHDDDFDDQNLDNNNKPD